MNDLYVPDALYPTDNDAEVPTLRADMQAEVCEILSFVLESKRELTR